jgi:CSLREA domain-containing protein
MSHTHLPIRRNLARLAAVLGLTLILLAALLVGLRSGSVQAAPNATFTVNASDDTTDGVCDTTHCSLREAIAAANANSGADTIDFDLGPGIPSITITVALPDVTGPLTIDGATGGATKVEINGNGGGYGGLNLAGGSEGSLIRNLVVNRFNGAQISLQNTLGNIRLEGNWVGIDATGTRQLPGGQGIFIGYGNDNNNHIIGGPAPEQRNVISGGYTGTPPSNSGNTAIYINSSFGGGQNVTIENNFIGLNVAGTAALLDAPAYASNGHGIGIGHTFGGGGTVGTIIHNNVIAGQNSGIHLGYNQEWGIVNTLITGNKIGTDATGTIAIPNWIGIFFFRGRGYNLVEDNLISGNGYAGIHFATGGGGGVGENFGTVIQNNLIGTDATGQNPLPNGNGTIWYATAGILIVGNSHDLTIQDNVIAYNTGQYASGIFHYGGNGVHISQNAIYANTANTALYGMGIDLNASGPSLNDPGDADTGANNAQNFPVIAGASASAVSIVITSSLDSTPSTTFQIEFFGNAAIDPTGYGEGQAYLGTITVTTDLSGTVAFSAEFPLASGTPHAFVTATATGPGGNTSEFSYNTTVTVEEPEISLADAAGDEGSTLSFVLNTPVSATQPITATYQIFDGTALAGEDYSAALTGELVIAPGSLTTTLEVAALADNVYEPDETFSVVISSTTTIVDGEAGGVIYNTTTLPVISADGVSALEDGGLLTFTLTLDHASTQPITVTFATSDGTALAGSDYVAISGTLIIPAGESSAQIAVTLLDDGDIEGDETFTLILSDPQNAALGDASVTGTILDDDAPEPPGFKLFLPVVTKIGD